MGRLKIQPSGPADRTDNYSAAGRGAGGDPRPGYCPAPDLTCAGLLLCGGGDIDSTLFGRPNRGSNPPDKARDRAELALFQAFYQAGKPILGVCRGMQVINIALGGDLIQDLPPEQKIFHTSCQGDLVHPIFAPEGSVLHQLYGHIFSVNRKGKCLPDIQVTEQFVFNIEEIETHCRLLRVYTLHVILCAETVNPLLLSYGYVIQRAALERVISCVGICND